MSREVRFSFDNEPAKLDFENYARAKGMTLSSLAKMALYQYRSKYPTKSHGGVPKDRGTVQSHADGGLKAES